MLIFSFIFACGIAYALPCSADLSIYRDTVRIHVIANSDSEEDQTLKLKVRDEVGKTASLLLQNCTSKKEAEYILSHNLSTIEKSADGVLQKEGAQYRSVSVIGEEYYPTRDYGTFRLPCGKYTSLQIKLGEAEGENWWCVIYPSFCLEPSCKKIPAIALEQGGYKIKFKIIETVQNMFSLL